MLNVNGFNVAQFFLKPNFVLGAADPEMNAIESALTALGVPFCFALAQDAQGNWGRVHPGNAYKATQTGFIMDDGSVRLEGIRKESGAYVECEVAGVELANRIDHHRPGDRGYGRGPAEYWEASSIGQVYAFLQAWGKVHLVLGWDQGTLDRAFGPERLLIAASDHCPSHAYAGKCPDVDVAALRAMRRRNAAAFQKKSAMDFDREVEAARQALLECPATTLGGFEYRIAFEHIPQLNHAQLELGIPVQYTAAGTPRDPRIKVGLLGGEPALIRLWMEEKKVLLDDVYGDPERGYAGGYQPQR